MQLFPRCAVFFWNQIGIYMCYVIRCLRAPSEGTNAVYVERCVKWREILTRTLTVTSGLFSACCHARMLFIPLSYIAVNLGVLVSNIGIKGFSVVERIVTPNSYRSLHRQQVNFTTITCCHANTILQRGGEQVFLYTIYRWGNRLSKMAIF